MPRSAYTGRAESLGPLFDPDIRRLAHRNDPESSKACARTAARSGIVARRRQLLLETIRDRPGLTSAEYAQATNMDKHEARRRITDLKNAGLVRRAGLKACSVSYGRGIAWRAK